MKHAALACLFCLASSAQAATDPCAWEGGSNRFTGWKKAAVAGLEGIPLSRHALLTIRAGTWGPTDTVKVYKDRIESARGIAYQPGLYDMHFGGKGKVCPTVNMAHWEADRFEVTDVWCVDRSCVAIPRVCGNVARIFLANLPTLPQPSARQVPEPSTLVLLAVALLALAWRTRRVTSPV